MNLHLAPECKTIHELLSLISKTTGDWADDPKANVAERHRCWHYVDSLAKRTKARLDAEASRKKVDSEDRKWRAEEQSRREAIEAWAPEDQAAALAETAAIMADLESRRSAEAAKFAPLAKPAIARVERQAMAPEAASEGGTL